MTNLDKLYNKSKKCAIFVETVEDLSSCQGFYSRLRAVILSFEDRDIDALAEQINEQNIEHPLDVVLWLEA